MRSDGKENVLISVEDARGIIESQLDSYRHLQNQAQRIIRILVAIIPVLVTIIISTDGNLVPVPAGDDISSIGPFSSSTVSITILLNYTVLFLLFMVVLLLFLLGFFQIASLLSPSQLSPALGAEDENYEVVRGNTQLIAKYDDWISKNEKTISKRRNLLNSGQKNLVTSFTFLFAIVVTLLHLSDGTVIFTLSMNAASVLVGVVVFISVIMDIRRFYQSEEEAGIKNILKQEYNHYEAKLVGIDEYQMPFPLLLVIILLSMFVVLISGWILHYWLLDLISILSLKLPYF